jgi:hypothetical protein
VGSTLPFFLPTAVIIARQFSSMMPDLYPPNCPFDQKRAASLDLRQKVIILALAAQNLGQEPEERGRTHVFTDGTRSF